MLTEILVLVALAFTYDWLASENERRGGGTWTYEPPSEDERPITYGLIEAARNEGFDWPPRWDMNY